MTERNFFEFYEQMKRRSQPVKEGAPIEAPPPGGQAMTVSQLTARIDQVIRAGFPAMVSVRGEVSNCSKHRASGHLYCTLKDANSCIDCVMFRDDASRVKFEMSDGLEVVATGRVAVYAQRGRYQLYISSVQPVGKGALELAFQQLRKKLEAEGLFAAERKKALPMYPLSIALVTSRAGAALQDMLKVLRRFPWVKVKLSNVAVQGEGSASAIAEALRALSRPFDKAQGREAAKTELIILSRGGGSLEDLWAFNEEVVARAVADSRVPIITGIGHEVDVSIADLVADYHAHTPTEAAAVAMMHWRNVPAVLENASLRLRRGVKSLVQEIRARLNGIERHETFRRPMHRVRALGQTLDERDRVLTLALLAQVRGKQRRLRELQERLESHHPRVIVSRFAERVGRMQHRLLFTAGIRVRRADRIDALRLRLSTGMRARVMNKAARVEGLGRELEALNPEAVLKRGYSVTMLKKGRVIVRDAKQVAGGDSLITKLSSGEIESVAEDPKQPKLF